MFKWIGDFFKALFDFIPKIIYLLYASLACILDVLQLFFRKLAGLDVYYVDGKAYTGDILTRFITGILGFTQDASYPILSTVFWSFIIFGIIILFASTLIAIVKSHYSYDDKSAKGPMQYVYTAGKAIINIVAVPVIVVLALYVSQALLTALDSITSVSNGTVGALYGDKVSLLEDIDTSKSATGNSSEKTYIYYDIFGFGCGIKYSTNSSGEKPSKKQTVLIGSQNQTFSGSLFKVAAYNANRARFGQITPQSEDYSGTSSGELFSNTTDPDILAEMIDTAFACNLHLQSTMELKNPDFFSSPKYFTQFYVKGFSAFSKFNIGAVWYYYDLWQFNFIVGFAGVIVCVTIFINIILGLITRLFMCIGLFLVYPPLFGLTPLDGGKAAKGWRENFTKQVLMAYGAVVGMNLMFLIMPYMNEIDFFNIPIADYFANILVLIVGLITIKAFIAVLSGLIGAADANETGGKIAEEVGQVAGKATAMTVGAAKAAGRFGKGVVTAPATAVRGAQAAKAKVGSMVEGHRQKKEQKEIDKITDYQQQRDALQSLNGRDVSTITKRSFMAEHADMDRKDRNKLWKTVKAEQKRITGEGGGTFNARTLRDNHGNANSKFAELDTNYSGLAGGRRLRADLNTHTQARDIAQTLKTDSNERYKYTSKKAGQGFGRLFAPLTNAKKAANDSYTDNKLVSKYMETSGIKPKRNYEKETAENTAKIKQHTEGISKDTDNILQTSNPDAYERKHRDDRH